MMRCIEGRCGCLACRASCTHVQIQNHDFISRRATVLLHNRWCSVTYFATCISLTKCLGVFSFFIRIFFSPSSINLFNYFPTDGKRKMSRQSRISHDTFEITCHLLPLSRHFRHVATRVTSSTAGLILHLLCLFCLEHRETVDGVARRRESEKRLHASANFYYLYQLFTQLLCFSLPFSCSICSTPQA